MGILLVRIPLVRILYILLDLILSHCSSRVCMQITGRNMCDVGGREGVGEVNHLRIKGVIIPCSVAPYYPTSCA